MPPTPATPQDLSIGEAVHRRKRAHPLDADHAPPPVYLSNNHIRTREKGTAPPRTPAQKRIRTRVRSCPMQLAACGHGQVACHLYAYFLHHLRHDGEKGLSAGRLNEALMLIPYPFPWRACLQPLCSFEGVHPA